jgi:hypothetical protein
VGGEHAYFGVSGGFVGGCHAVCCPNRVEIRTLYPAPYEIAFVQDASCPAGKVLKVTGAIRGLHRRKVCVTLAAEQASLAVATP